MPDLPLPDQAAIEAAEARIRRTVPPTPTVPAHDLADTLGQPLWLKAENLQVTGSFKARGARNWMLTASREELAPGLVTVSAGNHALALAWAARDSGTPVTVVMPEGSSPAKIAGTKAYGAKVLLEPNIQAAVERCRELQRQHGFTLVHPYDDVRVMAGQGTVGLELLRQVPEVDRILCPVGGGGLISGIGLVLKALKPNTELIGVEPEGAATLANAWRQNSADAALAQVNTVAASLAPVVVGRYTFAASRQAVDRLVTVPDTAIVEATGLLLRRGRLYVETGAAVGIAALLTGAVPVNPHCQTAAVITGGNQDVEPLCRMLCGNGAPA